MTREEYINFANCLKNNYTIDFDVLPEFCDMAISAVKWIPVTERLPEDKQRVLVDYGEEIGFMIINFNAYGHYSFKAWKPLPEPYKGGEV